MDDVHGYIYGWPVYQHCYLFPEVLSLAHAWRCILDHRLVGIVHITTGYLSCQIAGAIVVGMISLVHFMRMLVCFT